MTSASATRWLVRHWLVVLSAVIFAAAAGRVAWREWHATPAGTTVLSLLQWGDHFETAMVRSICDEFERAHPGVQVQVIQTPNYDSKLFTMSASGSPPDVYYVSEDNLAIWADLGILAPLDRHIAAADAAEGEQWRADIHPGLLSWFRWDGHRHGAGSLFGMPFWHTGQVMYVNTELFAKAGITIPWNGWTWEEWEDACARIAALTPRDASSGQRIWGGMLTSDQYGLLTFITNHGGRLFGGSDNRDDAIIALDEPAGMAALERIRRTRFGSASVYSPPSRGVSSQNGSTVGLDFGSGRVGILGPARYNQSLDFERSHLPFGWDMVPVPHPQRRTTSAAVGIAWAMSSQSKHPDLAFALLRHVSGAEAQRRFAAAGLVIPARSGAMPAVMERSRRPAHIATAIAATVDGEIPHWPQQKIFLGRFFNHMDAALKFEMVTPAQAVNDLRQVWNADRQSPLHRPAGSTMPWAPIAVIASVMTAIGGLVWRWQWKRSAVLLSGSRQREARQGLAFITPWLAGFFLLTLFPMGLSLALIFSQWSPLTELSAARWTGMANLNMLAHDREAWRSLAITGWYTVLAVPLTQAVALGLAVALSGDGRWKAMLRTLTFMTSLIGSVVVAALALWMFNNESGLVNAVLRPLLAVVGLQPPDWLTRDAAVWGVPALVLLALWNVGTALVIDIAALRGVPQELYEAARLDGAGPWRRFRDVTLPAISPVLQFNVVMAIVASFQVFTIAWLVPTSGDATLVFGVMIYQQGFIAGHMGYASALAWLLFAITGALTLIGMRMTRRMVHYEALR